MKQRFFIVIALLMMVAMVPLAVSAHTAEEPYTTDLLAGQYTDVGDVLVWNDDATLYVKYDVTDADWCITETHLQVSTSLDAIPQKKGNPIPGHFEINESHDPCISEKEYVYDISWAVGTELFVAAHAVVGTQAGFEDPNLDNFAAALPDQVTMSVTYPFANGPAYFPTTTVSGGTVLDGTYEGWCVDTEHEIYENVGYTANVYSSYEELPAGVVDRPENLDLVNWVINQGFVGKVSPGGFGTYTYGDVQRAIWELIDDGQSASGLGSWDGRRVTEIVMAAQTNGEGFIPGCDDYVAVLLQPVGEGDVTTNQVITVAQVTFASVGIPCVPIFEYETAWGDGADFLGKNWATYFIYTVQ